MLKISRDAVLGICASALCCIAVLDLATREANAKPINISVQDDLAFGSVAGDGSTPGAVAVSAATGAKSVSGGAFDFGGVHARARFLVTGDKFAAYIITLPGSITATDSGGPGSTTIDNFTSNPSGTGVFANNGKATLFVGATMNLGVGQSAGSYSGIFGVIVLHRGSRFGDPGSKRQTDQYLGARRSRFWQCGGRWIDARRRRRQCGDRGQIGLGRCIRLRGRPCPRPIPRHRRQICRLHHHPPRFHYRHRQRGPGEHHDRQFYLEPIGDRGFR